MDTSWAVGERGWDLVEWSWDRCVRYAIPESDVAMRALTGAADTGSSAETDHLYLSPGPWRYGPLGSSWGVTRAVPGGQEQAGYVRWTAVDRMALSCSLEDAGALLGSGRLTPPFSLLSEIVDQLGLPRER